MQAVAMATATADVGIFMLVSGCAENLIGTLWCMGIFLQLTRRFACDKTRKFIGETSSPGLPYVRYVMLRNLQLVHLFCNSNHDGYHRRQHHACSYHVLCCSPTEKKAQKETKCATSTNDARNVDPLVYLGNAIPMQNVSLFHRRRCCSRYRRLHVSSCPKKTPSILRAIVLGHHGP